MNWKFHYFTSIHAWVNKVELLLWGRRIEVLSSTPLVIGNYEKFSHSSVGSNEWGKTEKSEEKNENWFILFCSSSVQRQKKWNQGKKQKCVAKVSYSIFSRYGMNCICTFVWVGWQFQGRWSLQESENLNDNFQPYHSTTSWSTSIDN